MKYTTLPLLSLGLILTVGSLKAENRPNIVVFLVDDLRPELGCYDAPHAITPNIDALAKDGVKFNRAYVQEAISAPSRMSILTSKRPENIGIYSLFTQLRSQHPDMLTIPEFFKENDYKTISVGKVFHHVTDDKESWTTLMPRSGSNWVLPENSVQDGVKGAATECVEVEDEAYLDGRTSQQAIELLKENKDNNFVMFVGLTKPHLPFYAPKKYWDLYDRDQFEIPSKEAPEGINNYSLTVWAELRGYRGIASEGVLDDSITRELIHGYHAAVSFMDTQVGKVMSELDALGLRENTIVILLGDHGWKIGEYGAWCKHSNFEIDTNIPFIVSREGSYAARRCNVESDALVEAVDLFPTIVDLCGFDEHDRGLDGKSVAPLLDTPDMEWDDAAYSLYPRGKKVMGFTCTDGEYRYTEWWNNEESKVVAKEFYTCEQDYAKRSANLVDKKRYAKDVARLKSLLDNQFPEDRRSGYPQYDK